MANAARQQTLEARLHNPDLVVRRHRIQHIRIEEHDNLLHATFGFRILPRRDSERLLFCHAEILSDSYSVTRGF